MTKILFKELSYKIIGAAMEVPELLLNHRTTDYTDYTGLIREI